MIPKKIHQILILDGMKIPDKLPKNFEKALESYKTLNPMYEYTVYSGENIRVFIKKNYSKRFLKFFDTLVPYAFKCDFARLLVLNKEGGWYCDARQVCLQPLDKLASSGHEFYAAFSKPPHNRDCIANAFIGCPPNHPIIKKTIDILCWNIENKHYGIDCIYPTGPGALMNGAIDYLRQFSNKCNMGQILSKEGEVGEYYIFNNEIYIKSKYNDAEGADNSDLKGTNHYGVLWRNWQAYAPDIPPPQDSKIES
jgi:hypothetical protein